MRTGLPLDALVRCLDGIAPLELAGTWDNVGLIIDRLSPSPIHRVLLTIDLTEAVMDEALSLNVDAIVAYHPPIFSGLKRLTADTPLSRTLLRAIEAKVAIYSPHTALDAVEGGVCDWLLAGLGAMTEVSPIEPSQAESSSITGLGRMGRLSEPVSLQAMTERLKHYLGLEALRVAQSSRQTTSLIETVAVCPGAGGGLFKGGATADLFVTGEMSHHDIIERVDRGSAVILTDHSNSERGYLPTYAAAITDATNGQVEVQVATQDADPLRVVS